MTFSARSVLSRSLCNTAPDYDGRVVKAAYPVETRPNHWSCGRRTSLVDGGVGSNLTRIHWPNNQKVKFKLYSTIEILNNDL